MDVFKYLGRLMDHSDDNWTTVIRNIWKVRHIWGRLGKLRRQEGADLIILEVLYPALVQMVLIFGAEKLVLTSSVEKRL